MQLRNTVLQNPLSPSTVNFVSKKLQALTLCDNIEAVTWSSHEVIQPLTGFIFCEKLTIQFSKGELRACQNFLVDSELENRRQLLFNFGLSAFIPSLVNKKLDYVFKELKCATKFNIAFGLVLNTIEHGTCRYC